MTIEYVLLLVAIFGFGIKAFMSAPAEAFRESGPRLGARVERHLETGNGFVDKSGNRLTWQKRD